MTVRLNGATALPESTDSRSPGGSVRSGRSTGSGSSRSVLVAVWPAGSRAVSTSSRYDGYSWSGAANRPPATPGKSWIGWVWQLLGQWYITTDQLSAAAGSGAPVPSVACPENSTGSPTFHCRAAVGVSMTGVGGGGGLPTVIVTWSVPVPPCPSLTSSRAVTVAAVPYVHCGLTAAESSYCPSPSRSQA